MSDLFMSPDVEAGVEEAIARVLAAEQRSREAVAQAQADADAHAEAARAAQRRLAERTRRRLLRVREAFARDVQAREAEIAREAEALGGQAEPGAADLQRMARAVEQLAAALSEPPP